MKILSYRNRRFMPLIRQLDSANPGKSANDRLHSSGGRSHLHLRDEGQALVEYALLLPIIFALLTGILSLGLCLANYVSIENAADSAEQILAKASLDPVGSVDPCQAVSLAVLGSANTLQTATTASLVTQANGDVAGNGLVLSLSFAGMATLTGPPGASFSCKGQALPQQPLSQVASLTITYPCNIGIYGQNFSSSCYLKAPVQATIQ